MNFSRFVLGLNVELLSCSFLPLHQQLLTDHCISIAYQVSDQTFLGHV